jgi:hypothetical protein
MGANRTHGRHAEQCFAQHGTESKALQLAPRGLPTCNVRQSPNLTHTHSPPNPASLSVPVLRGMHQTGSRLTLAVMAPDPPRTRTRTHTAPACPPGPNPPPHPCWQVVGADPRLRTIHDAAEVFDHKAETSFKYLQVRQPSAPAMWVVVVVVACTSFSTWPARP